MKTLCASLLALFLLAGCDPAPAQTEEPAAEGTPTTTETSAAPAGGTTGSVQIHTTGGGIAPVTGTESLQGGGGGVNQAAKNSAHNAAAKAGGSSLDQLNSEEGY